MDIHVRITMPVPVKESDYSVPLPTAITYGISKKCVQSLDFVSVVFRAFLQNSQDFVFQFRVDPFIGINDEDPFMFRLWNRPTILGPIVLVFMLEYSVSIFLADFNCPIGAEGINYEQIVNPFQAIETLSYLVFHVVAGYYSRYFLAHLNCLPANHTQTDVIPAKAGILTVRELVSAV